MLIPILPAEPYRYIVQSFRISPARGTRLQVRTTKSDHLPILVAVTTKSVEKPEICNMKHQNTFKRIIQYLLFGGTCLISIAIMAFLLWLHFNS